jgi:hypothetical protein
VKQDEKENFLSRWSRLKREQPIAEKKPDVPAPALPPVEKLTPQSDFAAFMHPKVKDELRRVALKKLFNDPHFNTVDPFEPFSIDLTKAESMSTDMVASLNQARTVLFREEEEEKKKAAEAAAAAAQTAQDASAEAPKDQGEAKPDESRRQDT